MTRPGGDPMEDQMCQTSRRRMLTAAIVGAVAFLPLPFAYASGKPKLIAIANFGEVPALTAVVEGFKAEILKSGMVEGKDVVFTYNHVNFDATLIPQMISQIEATGPDLVMSVTTPVSQNVKNQLGGKDIPLVFGAVTDPVAAQLVPSWEAGDANMSGASDSIDLDATFAFARRLFPDAKRLGIPYNPGEANDVATLKTAEEYGPKHGFEVIAVGIDSPNDLQQRIAALAGKVDVLYGPGSSLIQQGIGAVASAANEAKIPLINLDESLVLEGSIPAAFAVSYGDIGRIAGSIALRALSGTPLKEIKPTAPAPEDHKIVISRSAMEAIGATIPAEFDSCDCVR